MRFVSLSRTTQFITAFAPQAVRQTADMSLLQMLTVHILNFLAVRFIHPVEAVPQFIRHHFLTRRVGHSPASFQSCWNDHIHEISVCEGQHDAVNFIHALTLSKSFEYEKVNKFKSVVIFLLFFMNDSDNRFQKIAIEPNI